MRYCLILEGVIQPPRTLPNRFEAVLGNFGNLSASELAGYGWYPYQEPEFDPQMQYISGYEFSPETNLVTATLSNIVYDLVEEKAKKITQIKDTAYGLLSPTDYLIIRNAETQEPVPTAVLAERASIRAQSNTMEAAVNALTDPIEVINYQITFTHA